MGEIIDGAALSIWGDLTARALPFILTRDYLGAEGSLMYPASAAGGTGSADMTDAIASVDATWGASDWTGPRVTTEAGTATFLIDDPLRVYDPGNPLGGDPAIGRFMRIYVDGVSVYRGRATLIGHDWAERVTTVETEDAIGEASRIAVTVTLAGGNVEDQAYALVAAAAWPPARFRIEGACVADRGPETFTGNLWEGLQRLQLAELGRLFADGDGVIAFRGRGAQVPPGPLPQPVVGRSDTAGVAGAPTTTIGTSWDNRVVNVVLIEQTSGVVLKFRDADSVAQYGEHAIEIAAADLNLA